MYICKLLLKNFRNIKNLNIELSKGINIFYGNNAQGKTNILEAIYFSSIGRSHRTHIDKELINFDEKNAYIQILVKNKEIKEKIDIHIRKDNKKGIAINNIPIKKLGELFGILHIVMFSPEDLQLVKSGPSERRKFMDIELCQISNIYYYNIQQYYKILKQRNNLLKSIQKNNKMKDSIFIWDEQLIEYGTKVIKYRKKFIENVKIYSSNIHKKITNNIEDLDIIYKLNVSEDDFYNKLTKNIEKDIFYGTTSFGPHKDDIIFLVNGIDVREYGSQGQQRSVSLSTKLSQIEIIKDERGTNPILLLDDVLSELDENRQNFLIESIKDIQTVITCTGTENILKNLFEKVNIYNVKNGIVTIKN